MSRVRRDHPRCRSATFICMCDHTSDLVIYSNFPSFIEIRSGVFEPCTGVEICPFPLLWLLASTTACTPVQAVMCRMKDTRGVQ